MQEETTRACAIWRCFRGMDRCVVFLAASVHTLPTVCRACLRILICESERALGADRSAQRLHPIRSRTIALSRSSERCLLVWGRGTIQRPPDDQATSGPRAAIPETQVLSGTLFCWKVVSLRLRSHPRRHSRRPAQLPAALLCLPPPPATTAHQWP